jgi:CheY-like chemotaxis protein
MQLFNENLDANTREGLEKIYKSGDMLLGIINDILDQSKIEAGKLELIEAQYELAGLIGETTQLNITRIGSKPVEFVLNINENMPALLIGDEIRIKQILNNILSNAFKYTEKGTVIMSAHTEPGDGDMGVILSFTISDTGLGMTEEQVGKLFDEYSRFNQESNRMTEGTGLGMSITHNLVYLMNGEINIESEKGKGSVFTVRLPQTAVNSDVLGAETAENLRRFMASGTIHIKNIHIERIPMPYGRVLVVDDVETNVYVAKGLLYPYKLQVDSVESGYKAIERIKNGNMYNIIFMDHMMPEMDGIETVSYIRKLGYFNPIVALTANALAGQADVFLSNGFDSFISKPINIKQLNDILIKYIHDKRPADINPDDYLQEDYTPPPQFNQLLLLESFVRDGYKTVAMLEGLYDTDWVSNADKVKRFTTNIHGIKSSLFNFGEEALSHLANRLEAGGRNNDAGLLTTLMPRFLQELKDLLAKLDAKKESGKTAGDENTDELCEKMLAIAKSCANYDRKETMDIISGIEGDNYSAEVRMILSKIMELTLHSDFEEAESMAAVYADSLKNNKSIA